MPSRTVVVRDGVELPKEQSAALWRAFREYLKRPDGDVEGFARAHGFASAERQGAGSALVLVLTSVAARATLTPPPPSSVRNGIKTAGVKKAAKRTKPETESPAPRVRSSRRVASGSDR